MPTTTPTIKDQKCMTALYPRTAINTNDSLVALFFICADTAAVNGTELVG